MLRFVLAAFLPIRLAFGGSSSPSVPAPPPPPPPPSPPPVPQSPQGDQAAGEARRRAAAAGGFGGTILTGPSGLTAPASTSRKTLLGG